MRRITHLLCLVASTTIVFGADHAKNIILFLGDAGGIPTLSAASIQGYQAPQKLFIQRMPHLALSDTSSTSSWVTDSAAGMTAIVTGQKTSNGTLSESPTGATFKTILEYAEEHGLSTGVVSNMNMADATPAACYSHVDKRKKFGDIFEQVWKPGFGDGVDIVFGGGRTKIAESLREKQLDLDQQLKSHGWPVFATVADVPANSRKAVVLVDGDDFRVDEATAKAIEVLSRNPKGYFLMVEWDLHPTKPAKALDTVVALDKLIERTVKTASKDTLVLFTADHSFDFRLLSGKPGVPLALPVNAKTSGEGTFDVAVGSHHSGEEVIAVANGPGAERLHGFMPNVQLFQIMLDAMGWKATASGK